MGIDTNLPLLDKAIAQLEKDLEWMRCLRVAIVQGDEAGRLKILHQLGFKDPELFPDVLG